MALALCKKRLIAAGRTHPRNCTLCSLNPHCLYEEHEEPLEIKDPAPDLHLPPVINISGLDFNQGEIDCEDC